MSMTMMSFIGSLSKQKNSVIILTDLEPDDVLAITMLKKVLSDEVPVLMVVGESPNNKTQMADGLLRLLNFKNFKIIQGQNSDKDFPTEALKCFDQNANADIAIIDVADADSEATCLQTLTKYLTDAEAPFIISLKPPCELLKLPPALLSKATIAQYGSFNLRCLFKTCDNQLIADFYNRSFQRVILYESFLAIGPQNSINLQNAPAIFAQISPELKRLIVIWNNHIVKDCLETVEQVSKKMTETWNAITQANDWPQINKNLEQINRNLKVVQNITDAQNMQMVLADFGLMAYLINSEGLGHLERGTISFNSFGYTQFTPEPSGKVDLIKAVNFEAMVQRIAEILAKN